jgi:hypothetical protein
MAFVAAIGGGFYALLILLVPFISVLPNGDSIVLDEQTDLIASMITRSPGRSAYLQGKLLGSLVTALIVSSGSLAIVFLVACFMYPLALPPSTKGISHSPHVVTAVTYQPHVLGSVLWVHPALYVAICIGFYCWASMALSLTPFAFARWVKNRYAVLALPLVVFWALSIGLQYLDLTRWIPIIAAGAYLVQYNWRWWLIILYWGVVLGGSLLMILTRPRTDVIREEGLI